MFKGLLVTIWLLVGFTGVQMIYSFYCSIREGRMWRQMHPKTDNGDEP